jgi:hypothetical protein
LAGSRTTSAIADAILSIAGFHLLRPADPGWWEQRVEWSVRMTASEWICRAGSVRRSRRHPFGLPINATLRNSTAAELVDWSVGVLHGKGTIQ